MKNLVFFLVLALLGCRAPADKKETAIADRQQELRREVDSLFHSKIAADGPGAAVLVAFDGKKLVADGFGLRDLEGEAPITPATNMRMGSVSKQFTALCILRLAERQLLSLSDPVTNFWPYPVFAGITVRHLINHTSGLADYEKAFMEDWDRSEIVENADVLDWLQTNPAPLFPPGTRWEYSNTAYLVLALLVEKVSGVPFATFAKEEVFKPAGMERTTFYNLADPVDIAERAFCYEKDSSGNWARTDDFFLNGVMGDGALYTSAEDYFRYDKALRDTALVSDQMYSRIFAPSSVAIPTEGGFFAFMSDFSFWDKQDIFYAMGWFRSGDIAVHSGSWYGTRTFVLHELERPLTIALFLNSDAADLRKDLLNETWELVDQYLQEIKPVK